MRNDQYASFRDLDRRCVACSLDEEQCREAVRLKRAAIESGVYQQNPLVRDVLEGRTTFVAAYDAFSAEFRGVRRFLPQPHDEVHNERLRRLAQIVPNVQHFTRRSIFAADNPVTCLFYGLIASLGVGMIWAHSMREDLDPATDGRNPQAFLVLAFVFAGFLAGLLAMVKYRTRDPNMIHAREAAAYMDLNYAFYRAGDDRGWADFIRRQSGVGPAALARPDDRG